MLACEQLGVVLGGTSVLKEISLSVGPGEVLGVVGVNGCGKSTLARCMSGMVPAAEGSLLLNGSPAGEKQLREVVGMVFQQPERQLFAKTAFEDVCFGPLNDGCTPEEAEACAEKVLEDVGIDVETARLASPLSFSGGQRRRIALAGVLALQTPYLILDEPDAGLDHVGICLLEGIISNLAEQGRGLVVIGHDLAFVGRVSDRIAVLREGHLLACGTSKEVLGDSELLMEAGLLPLALAEVATGLNQRLDVGLSYVGNTDVLVGQIVELYRRSVQ